MKCAELHFVAHQCLAYGAMRQQKHGFSGGAELILGAMLLWGTVGPAQALAGTPLAPAALGGWRLLVGGVVLGVLARRHLPALAPALRRGLARPLLVCAAATGTYQAAFLCSTARTGAALATTVALGTAPVATGIIARALGGERLTRTWLVSTAAAVTGCALLMAPAGTGADALGLLAGTASGVCCGLYTVFAKKLATGHPHAHLPTVSALSLLLGAVPLVPWMVTDARATGPARPRGLRHRLQPGRPVARQLGGGQARQADAGSPRRSPARQRRCRHGHGMTAHPCP